LAFAVENVFDREQDPYFHPGRSSDEMGDVRAQYVRREREAAHGING